MAQTTYEVDGTKAAMADLAEVSVGLLRVVSVEEASHLRVLGIARPGKQRHGNPSLFQPLSLPEHNMGYFVTLFLLT